MLKHGHKLKKSEWNGQLDAPLINGGLVVQHMSSQDVSCFAKDSSFTIIVRGFWQDKAHIFLEIEERRFPACELPTQVFLPAVFPSILWCINTQLFQTLGIQANYVCKSKDLVVSTRYVTSSENACGWASSSGARSCSCTWWL